MDAEAPALPGPAASGADGPAPPVGEARTGTGVRAAPVPAPARRRSRADRSRCCARDTARAPTTRTPEVRPRRHGERSWLRLAHRAPPSLNRRGRNPSQHRRLFVPAVQAGLTDILRHATPDQQTTDAPLDRAKQPVHLLIYRGRGCVKAQGPTVVFDIHAVEHESMHVYVQVQRSAKPLNDRHCPTAVPRHAVLPRAAPERPEHRMHEHTRDRPTQRVVPCEHVAQLVRQGQDPLAHRHGWKDVIDQVGARSAMRRPPQLGHTARRLQENGTRRSRPHPEQ
jgi:hypothetical protein